MPHIAAQFPNLAQLGPILDIHVGVPTALEAQLTAAGTPVPALEPVRALIDTGASSSVIRTGIAAKLGHSPVGIAPTNTPSSAGVMCPQFAVRFLFPLNIAQDPITVIEMPLAGQPIQALIGRDVLALATLIYLGPYNLFTLSF